MTRPKTPPAPPETVATSDHEAGSQPPTPPLPVEGEDADDTDDERDPNDRYWHPTGQPNCPICGVYSGECCCDHLVASFDVAYSSLDGGFLFDKPINRLVAALARILPGCDRLVVGGVAVSEYNELRSGYLWEIQEGRSRRKALDSTAAVCFLLTLLNYFATKLIEFDVDESTGRWAYQSWWAKDPKSIFKELLGLLKHAREPKTGNVNFPSWTAADEAFGADAPLPAYALPAVRHLLHAGGAAARRAASLSQLSFPYVVVGEVEALIGDEPEEVAAAYCAEPRYDVAAVLAAAKYLVQWLNERRLGHVGSYGYVRPDVEARIKRVKTFIDAVAKGRS